MNKHIFDGSEYLAVGVGVVFIVALTRFTNMINLPLLTFDLACRINQSLCSFFPTSQFSNGPLTIFPLIVYVLGGFLTAIIAEKEQILVAQITAVLSAIILVLFLPIHILNYSYFLALGLVIEILTTTGAILGIVLLNIC